MISQAMMMSQATEKLHPVQKISVSNSDLAATSDQTLFVDPPDSLLPRLSRIAPILVDKCLGCHNSENREGGYAMDTPAQLFLPGDTKHPSIRLPLDRPTDQPSDRQPSDKPTDDLGELYARLISHDPVLRMPLDADPLTDDQIEEIQRWILFGSRIDGSSDAPIESFLPSEISNTPKLQKYPKAHPVQALGIDPTRRWVFASGYQEVLLWELPQSALQPAPEPAQQPDLQPDLQPDQKPPRAELINRITTRGRSVSDLVWDPISTTLWVASGEPGKIGFIESFHITDASQHTAPSEHPVRRLLWTCRDTPLDIALSPSAERIAIGQADGSIAVLNTRSESLLWRATAHAAAVTSVDWSRDGKTLLSASRDRMGKSFQGIDGTMLSSFIDSERTVASLVALNKGAVGFDEAGVVRFYPNFTTPNARASRDGFPQQTHRLVANNDEFFVLQPDRVRHFNIRREEVIEPKGEDGKEKKKTNFHIDERESFDLANRLPAGFLPIRLERSAPAPFGSTAETPLWIAVGSATGELILWNPNSKSTFQLINQPSN
jgi:WD40 repeat protein